MGSFYTFKWEHPADSVRVTGDFDGWTKSVQLDKTDNGIFEKRVQLKDDSGSKIYYKFVVDSQWTINQSSPHEADSDGNVNNYITRDEIDEMAGKKNKQKRQSSSANKASSSDERLPSRAAAAAAPFSSNPVSAPEQTPTVGPGGFPATPTTEDVSVNPMPAAPGAVNPTSGAASGKSINEHVKLDKDSYEKSDALPSDKVGINPKPAAPGAVNPTAGDKTPQSASAINDHVKLDKDSYEKSDALPSSSVGINPMPAAPGAVNPVHLAPGEKIPPSASAIDDHVKLDKDSYERSDALPGVDTQSKMPPASKNLIPESSLPMGQGNNANINSVGPGATTAALAGAVPLEKDKNSANISSVGPDATTTGLARAVPKEDKSHNISSVGPDATTAGLAGAVPKDAAQVPDVVKKSQAEAGVSPEASAVPREVEEKSMVEQQLKQEHVPDMVKKSQAEAGVSPEASAVPREVAEKSMVEQQLKQEHVPDMVKKSQSEAGFAPEASAVPQEVMEKSQVEKELQEKVPVSPVTSQDPSSSRNQKSDPSGSAAGAAAATAAAGTAGTAAAASGAGSAAAKDTLPDRSATDDTDLRTAVNNVADKHINDSSPHPSPGKSTEPAQSSAGGASRDAAPGKSGGALDPTSAAKQADSDVNKPAVGGPSSQQPAAGEASRSTDGKAPEGRAADKKTGKAKDSSAAQPGAAEGSAAAEDAGRKSKEATKTKLGQDSTGTAAGETAGTATNGSETKPSGSGDSPAEATPEKKKKNRLSTIFSKLKHKLSDKN
ncbi:hypothetical protein L249_4776 [Ophiocordyceps polyrhachis-furcata BCC 54312]|uniref:AMP-activated protein kinase glycogen-binding domain-containing protein n=1 Tax=Ophiocordyceps polyrhachis-furcata BCC 54312 TaxID=1330021 RepID=A0A367L2B6_9HYPO|nr:hypothetical protein L249_4776 [Ophiocordyceps polyrhachis-furcata BCC 54312]